VFSAMGPYGQKFMHGDSTNVSFITMEMHGQLDIKKHGLL